MKKKVVVTIVMVILMALSTGGSVFASPENEAPSDPLNNSENDTFTDHPIVKNLMETLDELMETIKAYMEQVQEAVFRLASEEEEEPVEDPAPLPEEELSTTGLVEGRLVDNDRDPLSKIQVSMGGREATTDRNGFFFFEDVDFGSHELHLSDPNLQEDIYLTSFHIDENNPHYNVNFIVSLPDAETEEEEVEVAVAPVEENGLTGWTTLLLLAIFVLLIIAALLFFTRKHIRIVDANTGGVISKQRIKMYPKTRIDLTRAFEHAYDDAVRVQFLKPAIRKLSGYRVIFLKDEKVVSEIEDYTGELEHYVKIPEIPEGEGSDSESTAPEDGEFSATENEDSDDTSNS